MGGASIRKMLRMQARPAGRVRQGPLLIPGRVLLLFSGLLALALSVFNLFHELHAAEVDRNYTIVALAIGVVWLASIILAFRGQPVGVLLTGALAFIDLVVACVLTVMAAIVCWGHASGSSRRRETLPLLIVAAIGTLLAVLDATDNVHLAGQALPGFGTTAAEDGAFTAAIIAALWLVGGLWIARVRRTGALLIALATFMICYSFVILHVRGGTPLNVIATKSGLIWAVIAAAVAILAAASLVAALGLLVIPIVRRTR